MGHDESPEIPELTSTRSETHDDQGAVATPRRRAAWAPDSDSAKAGTRIKHYEVLRPLGRGGSAGVVLARDTKLDRLVALKIPRRSKHGVARLLAEACTLARLKHENIVMVHDVDASSRHPYMTLEYIRGSTLGQLSMPGGVRVGVALEVMIPVVRALAHIHERGIVHRDLKPQNIMIAEAGTIKLLDFGLAKRRGAAASLKGRRRLARPQIGHGTLLYMSPEQIRAEDVDHRSDIWAVGIILFELVSGKHPLAPFAPGWLSNVLDMDEPVPGIPDGLAPAAIAGVLRRCLMKRRDERFGTARELACALEQVAHDHGERGGTWAQRLEAFRRTVARTSYQAAGSYAAAARSLRVGAATLRRHADGFEDAARHLPPTGV